MVTFSEVDQIIIFKLNKSYRLIESYRARQDASNGGNIIKISQVDAKLYSKNDWATM
ncbi:hypothetical protein C2G38_2161299 [Gigaspora rosea]|uniref:Uncharacterized protein n=1 Tax=Gigaspora rosea TaxID=44941 RepID=A0A397W0R9_9GLOM|nr:hypothetical protein C2G38_2161299 [Gigaspora rosea]